LKALVATSNHILLVDLDTGTVRSIESHQPEYYGISWLVEGKYPIFTHSVVDCSKLNNIASYADSQKGYLSLGPTRSPAFLSDPHQISCTLNDWVITTNTGKNRVTIYDPNDNSFRDIKIGESHWDRNSDDTRGDHINSVYVKNDRLYVLSHGQYRNSYVLEYSFPECGYIARHDAQNRLGLHNIWVEHPGIMLSCHSASGELIDIKSNKSLWSGYASYARGMAVSADCILIGDTEFNEHHDGSDHCGIWIIKRHSYHTMDYIPLGAYGPCKEIRLLDVPDEAHHGSVFTNLDWVQQHETSAVRGNTGLHLDELLLHNRKHNLRRTTAHTNDFTRHMDFVSGCVDMNESGWMKPRANAAYHRNVTAISKHTGMNSVKLSFDYMFLYSEDLSVQNLGIIFNKHKNMAVCLRYTNKNCCDIYLAKNNEHVWEMTELLIPGVASFGKLETTKIGNVLKISINGSPVVEKSLDPEDAGGNIGLHCEGSYFRNFSLSEL